ncbi:MAG TPA: type I-U CRISPR-associated protein Csb2 [Solirubrobacteraceae bacterium]|jgi:CRISPR-associated protein Csb2|nr:type I-U CRISPR-associated protein Csb2 [Solirubrobacteraceae bacterium]
MIRVELRFPLGVYHALSSARFDEAEWPPSPVRLLGALLAAAHEAPAIDLSLARDALQVLCLAAPPVIVGPVDAAPIRGASRWAPRNHGASELRKQGLSPRNLGRERTAVHKGGTVVGERPVEMRWLDVELTAARRESLARLVEELVFLGTSRSPVIARILDDPPPAEERDVWEPLPARANGDADVRVPDERLLDAFDQRHSARRATGRRGGVESSGHVALVPLGRTVAYGVRERERERAADRTVDPCHWGETVILALDEQRSELRPKAGAAYLFARAFRAALLGAYGPSGSPTDAPALLRGHGEQPHAALVPLAFVGSARADGIIRGVAVVLPHPRRFAGAADYAEQRSRLDLGLSAFVAEGPSRRWIEVPGAGRVFLRSASVGRSLATLRAERYRGPAHVWETVLPIVHAHRRTSTGPRGTLRQLAADCAHVGVPEPCEVEVLADPPFARSPRRVSLPLGTPEAWRSSLNGPTSHVRLTFEHPVAGPLLLGRARHFGSGLCLPAPVVKR